MTAEHNHPPRCCCLIPDVINGWHQTGEDEAHRIEQCDTECGRCPACTHHGELARIAPILCPQCNAEIGQPHTDYCTLAPGRVWDGVLGQRVVAGGPRYDPPTGEATTGGRMTEDGPICVVCLQPEGHHYIDGTCPQRTGDTRHWSDGEPVDPAELDAQTHPFYGDTYQR